MTVETFTPAQANTQGKTTFKIDGVLYREVYTNCGKKTCKQCASGRGHAQIHRYTGNGNWEYVGTVRPLADPAHQPATCQRDGCANPTPRNGQKYCSAKCRVAANRKAKA